MKQIVLLKSLLVKNSIEFKKDEEFQIENSCLEKTPMYVQGIFSALINEIFSHKIVVDNLKEKDFVGFYLLVEDEVIPENIEKLDFYMVLDMFKEKQSINVKFKLSVDKDVVIPEDILKMASVLNHSLQIEMSERLKAQQ